MPPEVTFRVALQEEREDVTAKRSREKGSKVITKDESVAGRAEGRLILRAPGKECAGVQHGGTMSLECAGAMHRHCDLVRA